MDIALVVAQWSGRLPPGFVPPPVLRQPLPRCVQTRCTRTVWIKPDGTLAKSCRPCLDRRAASCRRRREHFVELGGCRRCAYRPRLEGDYLCERCREERDIERAQKRRDALDAAVIDQFAAKPDRAHEPSNLDCGVSPWNARSKPQPSGRLLVAAAGSRTQVQPGMASRGERYRLEVQALLIASGIEARRLRCRVSIVANPVSPAAGPAVPTRLPARKPAPGGRSGPNPPPFLRSTVPSFPKTRPKCRIRPLWRASRPGHRPPGPVWLRREHRRPGRRPDHRGPLRR